MKKNASEKNNIFVLREKIRNTPDVVTLSFARESGGTLDFIAGQYMTLYFLSDRFGWQGKSYSISSLPGEQLVSISVKKTGQFSTTLHNLEIGEKVKMLGPTGYFYPTQEMQRLVFVAGGIGIAPFYSIIRDLASRGELEHKEVVLLYSNKTKPDIVFFSELADIALQYPKVTVAHFLTREKKGRDPTIREYRRIDTEPLRQYVGPPDTPYCFLCGSIGLVNDLWQKLKEVGVPEEHLMTEAFY